MSLQILSPVRKQGEDCVVWQCPFLFKSKEYVIRNSYSLAVEDLLSVDRIDAAVVALLRFAIEKEEDIISEYPISEELYYNLVTLFIPVLCKTNRLRPISLNMPTVQAEASEKRNIVGTGISCGVDSLYTIAKHVNCLCRDHSLTHLMYFSIGAHLTKELDLQREQLAIRFSKEIGLPLIVVKSNLPDLMNEIGGRYDHLSYHTYMMAAVMLGMQKGIRYYYYSSTYKFDHMNLNLQDDCAQYDLLSLSVFSNSGMRFISSGGSIDRLEKVKEISTFPLSYKYLNVCIADIKNDGVCFKCIRTLLELDAVGAIDKYGEVFDIDFYKRNRKYYLYRLYYRSRFANDKFMNELYDCFSREMTPLFKIKAICHLALNRLLGRRKI
ncbi:MULTISPECIES: hypothetical protein [Bacteroidaceae]|jgi:hypothetical protein|uniref:Uncharacterized protein n=1 Tax=Bacteroides acidifaciens TaxID=85831 RepID=A0A4S2AYN6_9BACE|nr:MULTISPECIES: hypothetical protein [Bacteroidaceae]TGY06202.1 hypothetical protein E5356_07275 [Bacteroides acidifaciens]